MKRRRSNLDHALYLPEGITGVQFKKWIEHTHKPFLRRNTHATKLKDVQERNAIHNHLDSLSTEKTRAKAILKNLDEREQNADTPF